MFASHWHHIWFSDGPAPVPQHRHLERPEPDPHDPSTGTINTSFPKGQALSEWLVNVGASTTAGQLEIRKPRDNINAVDPKLATSWITIQDQGARPPNAVEFMSFNAPIGAADDQDLRARGVQRSARVGRRPATGRPTSQGQPYPGELHARRSLRAGEGARVHALRSLVLRTQGRPAPGAARSRPLRLPCYRASVPA